MGQLSTQLDAIGKFNNGFSFCTEILNEINNDEFRRKVTYSDISTEISDSTRYSYIYNALSAITDDVGGEIYENILNYIGNVSDIDTCTVHALNSIAQVYGIKYSIMDNILIDKIPSDILHMIDVLSMKQEKLFDDKCVSKNMAELMSAEYIYTYDNDDAISGISSIFPRLEVNEFNDDLSALFYSQLTNVLSTTYYDDIRKVESRVLNNTAFDNYQRYDHKISIRPIAYDDEILRLKTLYSIDLAFNERKIVDAIDNGTDSFDNYTLNEQAVLSVEKRYRNSQLTDETMSLNTRYAYYIQQKVQQYIDFIEYEYAMINQYVEKSKQYDIDKQYIVLTADNTELPAVLKLKSDDTGTFYIDDAMVANVATTMANVTIAIRDAREQLKTQAQKNYMKGDFLLLRYVISEYIKNNVGQTKEFVKDRNSVDIIEYLDTTEYYNISTSIDSPGRTDLNPRYWEDDQVAIDLHFNDNTNIFKKQLDVKLNGFAIDDNQLSGLYIDTLKSKFSNVSAQNISDQLSCLSNFLCIIYDFGADKTYHLSSDGRLVTELSDGRMTYDVDCFLSNAYAKYHALDEFMADISGYALSSDVLSGQLNDIFACYRQMLKDDYSKTVEDVISTFNTFVDTAYDDNATDKFLSEYEQIKSDFSTLTSTYLRTIAPYGRYDEWANENTTAIDDYALIDNIDFYYNYVLSVFAEADSLNIDNLKIPLATQDALRTKCIELSSRLCKLTDTLAALSSTASNIQVNLSAQVISCDDGRHISVDNTIPMFNVPLPLFADSYTFENISSCYKTMIDVLHRNQDIAIGYISACAYDKIDYYLGLSTLSQISSQGYANEFQDDMSRYVGISAASTDDEVDKNGNDEKLSYYSMNVSYDIISNYVIANRYSPERLDVNVNSFLGYDKFVDVDNLVVDVPESELLKGFYRGSAWNYAYKSSFQFASDNKIPWIGIQCGNACSFCEAFYNAWNSSEVREYMDKTLRPIAYKMSRVWGGNKTGYVPSKFEIFTNATQTTDVTECKEFMVAIKTERDAGRTFPYVYCYWNAPNGNEYKYVGSITDKYPQLKLKMTPNNVITVFNDIFGKGINDKYDPYLRSQTEKKDYLLKYDDEKGYQYVQINNDKVTNITFAISIEAYQLMNRFGAKADNLIVHKNGHQLSSISLDANSSYSTTVSDTIESGTLPRYHMTYEVGGQTYNLALNNFIDSKMTKSNIQISTIRQN